MSTIVLKTSKIIEISIDYLFKYLIQTNLYVKFKYFGIHY